MRRSRSAVGTGVVVALVFSLFSLWVPDLATKVTGSQAAAQPAGGLVDSAKLFGSTDGDFTVGHDGSAKYEVPLWVPEGRGHLQPDLSLSYNSRAADGLPGMGWTLNGLPRIERCPRTPAQDGYADGIHYDNTDAYCLDGQRLLPTSPPGQVAREYRTEREAFAKITALGMQDGVPDYFEMRSKNGQILGFGESADSQLRAYQLKIKRQQVPDVEPASDRTVTVAWAVNRVEDRNGNAVRVDYRYSPGNMANEWGADLLPNAVTYAPNRQIRFSYENRPDHLDRFVNGVHHQTTRRLAGITMYGGPQGSPPQLLRQYKLRYNTSDLTGRSLLATVEELDADGVSKMPQTFSYYTGSNDFDVIKTSIAYPNTLYSQQPKVLVGDVNGDGRDDLLYPDHELVWKLRLSTGSGFGAETDAGIGRVSPTEVGQIRTVDFDRDGRMDVMAEVQRATRPGEPSDHRDWVLYQSNGAKLVPYVQDVDDETADDRPDPVYFGDLDGNGMPDYLSATWDSKTSSQDPWYYRLNTGAPSFGRWKSKATSTMQKVASPRGAIFDVDGDGRAEIVGWNGKYNDDAKTRAFGMGTDGKIETNTAEVDVVASASSRHFADINGDGLRDVIYPYKGLRAQLNTANGFGPLTTSPAGYTDPPRPSEFHQSEAVNIVDVNGDGAQDVLVFAIDHPELWVWKNDTFVRMPLRAPTGSYPGAYARPMDVNGDGALDILTVQDHKLRILKRKLGAPDVLVAAGPQIGRHVEVSYTTLADRSVHTPCTAGSYPLICLAAGSRIVSQHRVAIPQAPDGWARFDHKYKAARMDVHGRGFLGFAEHKVVDLRNGTETVTTFDNVTRDGGTDGTTEVYPYAQLPKQVVVTVPGVSLTPTFRQTTTYTRKVRRTTPAGGFTVELTGTSAAEQEKSALSGTWPGAFRVRLTTTAYDDFGNPTDVSSGAAFGRRTTTKTSYDTDVSSWLVGLKKKQVTTACNPGEDDCTENETTFAYDESGNLTETVRQPDDPKLSLRSTTTYGESGTVKQVTTSDSTGDARTERFGYDADLLEPTTITNALGQTTTVKVHSGLGVVLESTDPNGVKTTMRYDKFGRPRETNYADGSFEHIKQLSFLGAQLTTVSRADGSESRATVDAFGRQIRNEASTFDGKLATVNLTYDAFNRVASESRPSTSGSSTYKTTYSYDNRGRVKVQTAPDGGRTTFAYSKLLTTITDPRHVRGSSETNLDGLVSSRIENAGRPDALETTYSYGPVGELTKVVGPDGGTQTMTYDVLARQVRHSDPSAGPVVSTYNAFGELTSETNGADEKSTFSHDDLGRVTKTVSPDGTATNTWDTAANGVGRLASATSADGVVNRYTYDDLGRTSSTTWTINGAGYDVGYSYDDIGRQASITYPKIPGVADRMRLDYAYNDSGYLSTVKNAADDTAYWTAQARNADGSIEKERLGNGLVAKRVYALATGLLTGVSVEDSARLLVDTSYGYDLNHNVAMTSEGAHARQSTYTYDRFNRMIGWSHRADAEVNVTFDYDKGGNLLKESTAGAPDQTVTYGYGENDAPRHAMTSRKDAAYRYDEAGRQVSGGDRTIAYNQLGLPTTITGSTPAERTNFEYDASGRQVQKRSGVETDTSVPGLFERRVSNGAVHNIHHIVADGRTVAIVDKAQPRPGGPATTTVSYLHADRQGSTVMVTDASGKPQGGEQSAPGVMLYDPFGQRVNGDYEPLANTRRDGTRQGFTGHEQYDELGLVDMKGRVYDAATRRFVSPDPFVPDPMSGQSYNRYSYVRNNPTTLVDPSGFAEKREDCNTCVGNEVINVPPVDVPPSAADLFDVGAWFRGWGQRGPGIGGREYNDYLRGLGQNDPRLNPHLNDQLRDLRIEAQQAVAELGSTLTKLNADQLAELIAGLEAKVAAQGTCEVTSDFQCFMNNASLDQALALSKFRNGMELRDDGNGGSAVDTRYNFQVQADAAKVNSGANALTGNIVSASIFAATGSAGWAEAAGGLFGGLGGAAKLYNNGNAFNADPERNPLPVDHFGPVYDRFSN